MIAVKMVPENYDHWDPMVIYVRVKSTSGAKIMMKNNMIQNLSTIVYCLLGLNDNTPDCR